MIQTLLLISRWIGQAHDQWRAITASGRPLAAEIDFLHEQLALLRSENKILRTRLLRLPPRKRPRFKPWQRLQVLLHASRYGGEGATEVALGSTVGIIPYNEVSSETRQRPFFGLNRGQNSGGPLPACLLAILRRRPSRNPVSCLGVPSPGNLIGRGEGPPPASDQGSTGSYKGS